MNEAYWYSFYPLGLLVPETAEMSKDKQKHSMSRKVSKPRITMGWRVQDKVRKAKAVLPEFQIPVAKRVSYGERD